MQIARDLGATGGESSSAVVGTLHTTRAGRMPLYASAEYPVDPNVGSTDRLRTLEGIIGDSRIFGGGRD